MKDQTLERRPARRDEIIAAAHAIAAEAGWQAVSVRRVAARVGCSAAALYQYLPDKDAILRSIALAGEEQLATSLQDALMEHSGRARRLRALARAYLAFVLDNPELYRVMHGLDGVPRLGSAPLDGPVAAVLRLAAAGLVEKYRLEETAGEIAHRLLALLHGHAALALAGGNCSREQLLRLQSTAMDEALRGLARH